MAYQSCREANGSGDQGAESCSGWETQERENSGARARPGGPDPRHHLLGSWGVVAHAYPRSGVWMGSPRTRSLFPRMID